MQFILHCYYYTILTQLSKYAVTIAHKVSAAIRYDANWHRGKVATICDSIYAIIDVYAFF